MQPSGTVAAYSAQSEEQPQQQEEEKTADEQKTKAREIVVEIPVDYELHLLETAPSRSSVTNSEDLMSIYREMSVIRRLEITADMLFKSQQIRGFCHLYDGQEAVCVGMEKALNFDDSVITAYRDHGIFIGRGGTVFVSNKKNPWTVKLSIWQILPALNPLSFSRRYFEVFLPNSSCNNPLGFCLQSRPATTL
jgi:hypothetical protein